MHHDVICRAINAKQLLAVRHTKGPSTFQRVVEPYLLFATKAGNLVLHSRQVEGEYDKTTPPDWCNMHLSALSVVTPLERFYEQPHPNYNPHSELFHRVLCHVPLEIIRV